MFQNEKGTAATVNSLKKSLYILGIKVHIQVTLSKSSIITLGVKAVHTIFVKTAICHCYCHFMGAPLSRDD